MLLSTPSSRISYSRIARRVQISIAKRLSANGLQNNRTRLSQASLLTIRRHFALPSMWIREDKVHLWCLTTGGGLPGKRKNCSIFTNGILSFHRARCNGISKPCATSWPISEYEIAMQHIDTRYMHTGYQKPGSRWEDAGRVDWDARNAPRTSPHAQLVQYSMWPAMAMDLSQFGWMVVRMNERNSKRSRSLLSRLLKVSGSLGLCKGCAW